MTTMAYQLAANPEWQERLRDEGDRLIGDAPLDIDTLDKLETFDLVIKECLRMVTRCRSTSAVPCETPRSRATSFRPAPASTCGRA